MNVVIIGVGALGKRHLESVSTTKKNITIICFDSNKDCLDSIPNEMNGKKIVKCDSYENFPKEIEYAIIATTSRGRSQVVRELLSVSNVKYMLLEKFLFQTVEEYEEVLKLLNDNKVKSWVNCVRREYKSWKLIKELVGEEIFSFEVQGTEWGLCCNGIHMLDIVGYLANDNLNIKIDNSVFYEMIDSKRLGYKELYGSVEGKGANCKLFKISCDKGDVISVKIIIETSKYQLLVDESNGKMVCVNKNNNAIEEKEFICPYLSQISVSIMEKIIDDGTCSLPELETSMRYHLILMNSMLDYFEMKGIDKGICPIT